MRIPILLYHLVGTGLAGERTSYFVPQDVMHRQWRWLKRRGYNSITVYDLYLAQQGKFALPVKPLIITFDDGYRDTFLHAKPIAESLGFKITIFVTAGKIGDPTGIAGTCGEGYGIMNTDELRKLVCHGHDVESHGLTHARLCDLDDDYLWKEVEDSRKVIEEAIDRKVIAIAYPHGKTNDRVMHFCKRAGYHLGFLAKKKRQPFSYDNLALERININRYHTVPLILWLRLTFRNIGNQGVKRLYSETSNVFS
ncbi:MAG: polysaccharide deacetylase family protein [bacterium]